MSFKDFISEMPVNLYDLSDYQPKKFEAVIAKQVFSAGIEDGLSGKKLFGKYLYFINDNFFFVYSGDTIDLYITFEKKNKTMKIKTIQKFCSEKNFSLKVYRAILELKEFTEIETGDSLSTANIKAHEKMLQVFNIFVRKNGSDIKITDAKEFKDIIKNSSENEVFVLKESNVFRKLGEMYGATFEENLSEFLDGEILTEKIIEQAGKFIIMSKKGKKLGEYDTEEEAKKRLRQIEYFKHKGK